MAESKSNGARIAARLTRTRGFVLDMDGTLVLGDKRNKGLRALPGAVDFIAHLEARGTPYMLFTNGTVRPPAAYVGELKHAGFDVAAARIMTPSTVAARYFLAKGYKRILVLGGEGVSGPLADAGLEIVRPPERENIDAVYAGWFREFGMADIEAACEAVWRGAKPFAASLVPYFASAEGRTLGTSAAIAGAIDKITGSRTRALGKPAKEAMRAAAQRLGAAAKDICVIGDDPHLETLMAARDGALAIGVTTGVAKEADYAAMPKPRRAHHVAENIGAVLDLWRAHSR
ncbi:MAG: HAD hydrolase-like protein [Rhizomicrobium sp.]